MGLTEAYYDILLKAFVEGVEFVARDLQTIKERLAIPNEDSLREALALASDELSAMTSLPSLSLPEEPLHSHSNSLVKALASLSREERVSFHFIYCAFIYCLLLQYIHVFTSYLVKYRIDWLCCLRLKKGCSRRSLISESLPNR